MAAVEGVADGLGADVVGVEGEQHRAQHGVGEPGGLDAGVGGADAVVAEGLLVDDLAHRGPAGVVRRRVPAGGVRALEGAVRAAGAVDEGLGDAAEDGGDVGAAGVHPAEGVEEGLGAVPEGRRDAGVVAGAGAVEGGPAVAGVVGRGLGGADVGGGRAVALGEAGVQERGELVAGDRVGAYERHAPARAGELAPVAGQERGLAAVDGVRQGAAELLAGEAVAADERGAGRLERGEHGAAVLAVGADDGDGLLPDRAPGALGGRDGVVALVAGEDPQLAAVDAAVGVDPAGVGGRHGGHAAHVDGPGALGCPGHDGDGVPGGPAGPGQSAAAGEQRQAGRAREHRGERGGA